MQTKPRSVVNRRIISRTALALAAVFLLLQQSAAADIYYVPPTPVRVALKPGEQAVSVRINVDEQYPPQRAYMLLALIGHPVFVPPASAPRTAQLVKPAVEDATPSPLKAEEAVSSTDLDAVRSILQAQGIPANAITARMAPAPGGTPVGEILIAVLPVTAAQFDSLAAKVSSVIAQYPAIVGAGTIVAMDTCNAKNAARARGLRQAMDRAGVLGRAAGFTRGPLIQSDQRSTITSICGKQLPWGPLYADGSPRAGDLGAYQISLEGGAAFRISSRMPVPGKQIAFLDSAQVAENDFGGVMHQFVVPDSEPFVGAQGHFTGVVRPDAAVAAFAIHSAQAASALVKRLTSAGANALDMYRTPRVLFVKMQSPNDANPLQRLIALENPEVVDFVKDCDSARSAVAAGAFRDALARAKAMASSAHLRVGGLIAVSDAGTRDDALCGYGKDAKVKELALAMKRAVSPVFPSGNGATFSSSVDVAWHLDGVSAAPRTKAFPIFPSPYAFYTIHQAFTTHGEGALGSAKRTFEPNACNVIRLQALAEATRDALAHSGPGKLQAIADQGEVFQPSSDICGLKSNAGYGAGKQSLEQRVFVITSGR